METVPAVQNDAARRRAARACSGLDRPGDGRPAPLRLRTAGLPVDHPSRVRNLCPTLSREAE